VGWCCVTAGTSLLCVPCDMYGGPLPALLVGLRNNRSVFIDNSFHMMDWTTSCVCVCVCVFCVCVFLRVVFVLLTLLPQGGKYLSPPEQMRSLISPVCI
jgi:hypothetical protein